MLSIVKRNDKLDEKLLKVSNKASNKLNVELKDLNLLVFDKIFLGFVFVLGISNKKIYLLSSDKKGVEELNLSSFDKILIEKKTDLNMYLKEGRMINLTSVVGIKSKVVNKIKDLNSEITALK